LFVLFGFIAFSNCTLFNKVKPAQDYTLEVNVLYDGSQMKGNMFLRGDNLGLSWDVGIKMVNIKQYYWQLNLTFTSDDFGKKIFQ